MKEFWDKVIYFREHLDELPKPKEKKTPQEERGAPHPYVKFKPISDEDMYVDDWRVLRASSASSSVG